MTPTEAQHWAQQVAPLFHEWTGWAAAVAAALLFVAAATRRRGMDLPYVAADALLTPAERHFFLTLQRALAEDYQLFAKVRLGDILQVKRGIDGKRRYAAFGRISSKHADFVVCEPRTFVVLGVVELDDSSHQRPDRQERDRFFDAALAVADIPVLRVPVQRTYSPGTLREQAREAFGAANSRR